MRAHWISRLLMFKQKQRCVQVYGYRSKCVCVEGDECSEIIIMADESSVYVLSVIEHDLIFCEPEVSKGHPAHPVLFVFAKTRQILVHGEWYANHSRMAQRRFAVSSTHMCIWFANHSVRSYIRGLRRDITANNMVFIKFFLFSRFCLVFLATTLTSLPPEVMLLNVVPHQEIALPISKKHPKKARPSESDLIEV